MNRLKEPKPNQVLKIPSSSAEYQGYYEAAPAPSKK